jgi:hypothetical protein
MEHNSQWIKTESTTSTLNTMTDKGGKGQLASFIDKAEKA